MVVVEVPASSANLGPGFDCFGMALEWRSQIALDFSADGETHVHIEGDGSTYLRREENNLVLRCVREFFQQVGQSLQPLQVVIRNNIPLARGLGSSAAAIVGSLVAANALLDYPMHEGDLLHLADRLEGHADNVAAALHGGVTIAYRVGDEAEFFRMAPPPHLSVVVAVPGYRSRTSEARQVLPRQVNVGDACDNVSRAGLFIAALLTGRLEHLDQATRDSLHQPYRLPLFPGTAAAIDAARQAGALGAALSGAGPTAVALFQGGQAVGERIGQAMRAAFAAADVQADCRVVSIALQGARVLPAAM